MSKQPVRLADFPISAEPAPEAPAIAQPAPQPIAPPPPAPEMRRQVGARVRQTTADRLARYVFDYRYATNQQDVVDEAISEWLKARGY